MLRLVAFVTGLVIALGPVPSAVAFDIIPGQRNPPMKPELAAKLYREKAFDADKERERKAIEQNRALNKADVEKEKKKKRAGKRKGMNQPVVGKPKPMQKNHWKRNQVKRKK